MRYGLTRLTCSLHGSPTVSSLVGAFLLFSAASCDPRSPPSRSTPLRSHACPISIQPSPCGCAYASCFFVEAGRLW